MKNKKDNNKLVANNIIDKRKDAFTLSKIIKELPETQLDNDMVESLYENSGMNIIKLNSQKNGVDFMDREEYERILNTPIIDDKESFLGSSIADEYDKNLADTVIYFLIEDQIKEAIGLLNKREQKLLKLRFGMEDGRTRTLNEVAKEMGITRERTRQIEKKLFRKLRKIKIQYSGTFFVKL